MCIDAIYKIWNTIATQCVFLTSASQPQNTSKRLPLTNNVCPTTSCQPWPCSNLSSQFFVSDFCHMRSCLHKPADNWVCPYHPFPQLPSYAAPWRYCSPKASSWVTVTRDLLLGSSPKSVSAGLDRRRHVCVGCCACKMHCVCMHSRKVWWMDRQLGHACMMRYILSLGK